MTDKLNVRFLLIALGTLVVLGVSWFGVHAFQMRQHVGTLLELVNRAEEQGKSDRAARLLGQYVKLVPEDLDSRIRYGLLLEKLPSTPGLRRLVASVYEQVLIRDPGRHDIQRRLAILSVGLGQVDEAITHLQTILVSSPKDAEVADLLGQCQQAKANYAEAKTLYQQAIHADPERIGPYVRCARLQQLRFDKPAEADRLMDELVERNKASDLAYLERARYRKEFKIPRAEPSVRATQLDLAEADAAEARRLAPEKDAPLIVSAELAQAKAEMAQEPAQRKAELNRARSYLEQGIRSHPKVAGLYQALAGVETADNRPEEAIACLQRGLKELPDHDSLLFALGQLLIQTEKTEEARATIEQLRELKAPPVYTEYLKALLEFRRAAWFQAHLTLEAMLPLLPEAPELAARCYLLLAQCYAQMGAVDDQLSVYRRANDADPFNVQVRLGTADALLRLGRIEEAIEECQRVLHFSSAPASGWVLLTRLMVLQNVRLPMRQQNWKSVEVTLDQAGKTNPESSEIPILRVEVLVAQNKAEAARKLLENARDKQPKKVELRVALADLALHEGQLDAARKVLDKADKELGDDVDLRLARARCLLKQRREKLDVPALSKLTEGLEKFNPDEQARLLGGLAESYLQSGEPEKARALWNQLTKLRPEELRTRLLLFDSAMRNDDESTMLEQLRAIRRIEGSDGPLGHFGAACHLVWQARKGNKDVLSEAQTELSNALALRPGWWRIPLLRAEIAELEGNEDLAIENYLRARELGDRQFGIADRLVRLLHKHQRYADAEAIVRKLPEQEPMSADLRRLIAEISLQTGEKERALEAARKAIPDSKDYRDYIWLGQMLWALNRFDEAETTLRRAVELGETSPAPWVVLVQYLARTRRPKDAEAVLRQAEKKLPKKESVLALAQCYEAIGNRAQAEKFIEAAIAAAPTKAAEVAARQSAASLYLRFNLLDKAKAELHKILELKETSQQTRDWSRHVLTSVLALSGDYQDSRQAMALLGLFDEDAAIPEPKALNPDDVVAQALVLGAKDAPGEAAGRQPA